MNRVQTSLLGVLGMSLALVLSGCGTEDAAEPRDSESPSQSPTSASPTDKPSPSLDPADFPACDTVWVEDADLPRAYKGCADGDTVVKAEVIGCSSGQRLVVFDDAYWAVRGHVIRFAPEGLKKDKRYKETISACRA